MRYNHATCAYLFKRALQTIILIFVINSCINAQNIQISGRITSNEGDTGVAGASIKIKGLKGGTIASENGSFNITAPGTATLVISAIGYDDQEIAVQNRTNITIHLSSNIQSLQQIVVVGYGTQKRRDLTGSVSSITAATIQKVPVISAAQALQGRAAGVQVTNNDGAPGGNISILIRGTGSLASYGNDPLFVVDGYPVSTGINNINPADIASIDVLKDASAIAIYGIRAANGVVIVSTKRGLKGKAQVSLDAYNAFQSVPKKYDILNAQQFATLSNDVEASDSTHTYHGLDIWHTPDQLHSVDWQDALYNPGLTQSYTLGIRGGSDKVQSAVSAGFYDQKGIVAGSYFKRFSLNLNMDYEPVKWLKSSTNVAYDYQEANNPLGTQSSSNSNGLFQLYVNPPTLDDGNKFTYQIKDDQGNYGFFNPLNPNVYKFSNPFYGIDNNQSTNITNYVLASSSLEATIFDGLRIKTNIGANFNNFNGSYFQPGDSIAHQQYPSAKTNLPFYNQKSNQTFEWLWENTISYDKTFGKHTINFVGGISAQKNTGTFQSAQGTPPNNTLRNISNLDPASATFTGGDSIYTLESQFARLTYNFADKYLITGTVRRDGSSKFDSGHKYGVFPSGAIAWRAKQESFLQDVTWLSDLKIRGSYGEIGNQSAIGLFRYQALYGGNYPAGSNNNGNGFDNFGYPFNKIYQNGIAPTQPSNPDLKWETDYETDIGLDAGFMNNALTVTVDWYNRKSKNFLLNIAVPAQTGFLYITRNVGTMENKGVELAVNYNGNSGKDLQYNVGLTLTHNENTLTSIASGTSYISNFGGLGLTGQGWSEFTRSYVGKSVGEFYGYKSIGIFQTQAQIDALNAKAPVDGNGKRLYWQAGTSPGDVYFADINGDDKVTADSDRVALGNPQPKVYGGLNLDFSYKAWDFNLYFYGSFGNKILNYIESDLESFQKRGSEGVENVSQNYFENRWTPTNPSDRYARALANDDQTLNLVPSNLWVEDGSYVKLKNLTIGYTLPANILQRASISKLRIYVSGQNLFTITKYSGLDPEIGVQNGNATQNGVDNGVYPSSRFYTVGLNITF